MPSANRFESNTRATLVAITVVLLLALDLLAGALLPRPGAGSAQGKLRVVVGRRYDPRYHHGFAPYAAFSEPWGLNGETYPIVTNSLGLKDSEPREVSADTPRHRILFLGDSFVEGIGVPYEETFVGLVDRRLGRERFDVLGAGIVGSSPKLYYHRLKYLLEDVGLRVDEVYVFMDMSDPHNEIELGEWEPGMPAARPEKEPGPIAARIVRHSYVAGLAWEAYRRFADSERRAEAARIDDEMYLFFDPGYYERWGRTALDRCESYMQRIADLCRARSIRLAIVVYPHPIHILGEDLSPSWSAFWSSFAARNHATFVDLFPAFIDPALIDVPAEYGKPRLLPVCAKFFITRDLHWKAAGHRFVADHLPVPIPR